MKVDGLRYLDKDVEEEMEKEKPSNDPAYWAKKSCKHCCGRGVIGTQTTTMKGNNTISQNMICVCCRKNYRKWREDWLAKKDQEKIAAKGTNGSDKPKEPSTALVERLERIGDHIAIMNAEIIGCDTRMNELPQHSQIAAFNETIQLLQNEIMTTHESINAMVDKCIDLHNQAQGLLEESRMKTKEAVRIEFEVKGRRDMEIPKIHEKIQGMEQAKGVAEAGLSRAEHQIRRRRRVAQDKLDRLEDRKYRLLREGQVESTPDSEDLSETV